MRRNNKGGHHDTTVYDVEDETESLIGKEDATALGILNIDPDGKGPGYDRVRCITPEILKDEITTGIVSGGKTQPEINVDMEAIATKHAKVFEGMGRTKVEPIHLQMKPDAKLLWRCGNFRHKPHRHRPQPRVDSLCSTSVLPSFCHTTHDFGSFEFFL